MKKSFLILSILLISISSLFSYDLGWTSQEKYVFTGLTYDGSNQSGELYYDIFTGDFPFIIDIHPGTLSIMTGLPLHRPTPFFLGLGTDMQVGFFNDYSEVALIQSGSMGFEIDLFGDLSIDKFITIGSRFYNLSHGFRFYEDSMRLQNSLSYSMKDVSVHGETVYGIEEGELLDWSVTLDYRIKETWSLRCSLEDDMRISLAFGLSHYDPPVDKAADLDWDYVGAHRGSMLHAPENTAPAFSYALGRDEISFIETDMNITADGEYVAVHDLNFLRYAGRLESIKDLTLEEIKEIDMGSFYNREYAGEPVLTLEEVADEVKDFSDRGGVMLEVKLIGEGPEAMERFLSRVRAEFSDSTPLSYMTLYYDKADLLKEMVNENESWGLCYLNAPELLPFMLYTGFIYPLFEAELTRVVELYEPDYIMLTTDYHEYYDRAVVLSEKLGVDILFWDFKDTIFGISHDGADHPGYFKKVSESD